MVKSAPEEYPDSNRNGVPDAFEHRAPLAEVLGFDEPEPEPESNPFILAKEDRDSIQRSLASAPLAPQSLPLIDKMNSRVIQSESYCENCMHALCGLCKLYQNVKVYQVHCCHCSYTTTFEHFRA